MLNNIVSVRDRQIYKLQ